MTRTSSEIFESNPVVATDPSQLGVYAVDGMVPERLFAPGDVQEAREVLVLASRERASILPHGNGTKMGWGNVPSRLGWVLSTGRLTRITECDHENLTLTAESGIPLSALQKHLQGIGRGYFIPLDPPFTQQATVGGIVATDSNGPKRHLYGTARDLILGLKVLLPNGQLNRWGGRTVKNVAGYDMSKLYVGSYGTLGLITEVTFRLLPLPEKETTLLALFKETPSAFAAAAAIRRSELIPSAVEVSNPGTLELLGFKKPSNDANALFALSFEGFHESVERQIRQAESMLHPLHPLDIQVLDGNRQEEFWKGLTDFDSLVGLRFPGRLSCRISVPLSGAAEVFRLWNAQGGLDLCLRSHAGAGIVHVDILPRDSDLEISTFGPLLREMRGSVETLGGILTLRSVPLPLKREVDVWGPPGESFPIMENLKSRLDPDRRFNPGRFVGGI